MKKLFFLTLTILFLYGIISTCQADTLEQYTNHSSAVGSIYGARYMAQTWTSTSTERITNSGIKVWLWDNAIKKTTLNFTLCRLKSTGYPTDGCAGILALPDWLARGTIYASSINPASDGNEYHIIWDSEPNERLIGLNTSTQYVIVMTNTTATTGTSVGVRGSSLLGTYSGGKYLYTNDGGLTWSSSTEDLYFKIMGELITSATSEGMCICTTTLSLISNASTGAEFWLDKSISYGDFLVVGFLTIFLACSIFIFTYKSVWKS